MRSLIVALSIVALTAAVVESSEFHPITPCRYVDTRVEGCIIGGSCHLGPFVDDETRRYLVAGSAICPMTEQWPRPVPLGAEVVVITLTAVDSTNRGHLIAYDNGLWERPRVSTLNFQPGQATSTLAYVALAPDPGPGFPILPDMAIFARVAEGGSVHIIIDIVGYFK